MGLFSIFRRPRDESDYMDSNEYIHAPRRDQLPSGHVLPSAGELTDVPSKASEELAEMFLDASQASEEEAVAPMEYIPLDGVAPQAYDEILALELPEKSRVTIQMNTLYARDHEKWMLPFESELRSWQESDNESDLLSGLAFRSQQLENRKLALQFVALELEACGGVFATYARGIREKIWAIDRVLTPSFTRS